MSPKATNWAKKTRILFELGYLTVSEAMQELQSHGVTETNARILTEKVYRPMPSDAASRWKTEAENVASNLRNGVITNREAYDQISCIGYSDVEVRFVLEYLTT